MSSNLGEVVKKLIPVFGEKPNRGLPKPSPPPPPPPARRLDLATFTRGENTKLNRQAPNPAAQMRRRSGGGGGGGIPLFLNNG